MFDRRKPVWSRERGFDLSFCRDAALLLSLVLPASQAGAEALSNARYIEPVARYGHFALGHPHEYAAVTATGDTGAALTLRLTEGEVFEDVIPRLVRLTPNGPEELLVIISERASGSRLVLLGRVGEQLKITAQSVPIGRPMRWLNPVGVADLDGDGNAEVAAVITPHIGGTLKVYRRTGEDLVEHASLDGFSNHVYGSPEQKLSTIVRAAGRAQLLVPDSARQSLRLIALINGQLVETARCPLASPLTGPLRLEVEGVIWAFTGRGRSMVDLAGCRQSPTQSSTIRARPTLVASHRLPQASPYWNPEKLRYP